MNYKCTICGFVYDENQGYMDDNIEKGTLWEQVPSDWLCPICGVDKTDFEKI